MYDEKSTCIDSCDAYLVKTDYGHQCVKRCSMCVNKNGVDCEPCGNTATYVIDYPARQRQIVEQCEPDMHTYKSG